MFTRKRKKLDLLKPIYIKQISIHSNSDFSILRHNLLEGHIMVCNLSPLVKIAKGLKGVAGNRQLLHSHLQLIRSYCVQHGGNVTKLKESVLLITPNEQYKIESK